MDTTKFIFEPPVAIADDQALADAKRIIAYDRDLVDPEAREMFDVNNRADFELTRFRPNDGLLLISGPNGAVHSVVIWVDKDYPDDPDLMFGLEFALNRTEQGVDIKLHRAIAGDEFQGVLKYRRDRPQCCERSKRAMSALVFLDEGNGIEWAQRDTVYTQEGCRNLFRNAPGGVVQSTAEMQSVYERAKAYRPAPGAKPLAAPIAALQ